ncbi:SPOR domain-containing protein [Vulcaniibacterium gelatinicum]|uniref:SPOR domain-containing protein n=1 Tax=Vulcaniibacterium gelatinicum TaxID=2598725 RepID=UPI0011C8A0E3|nr:SPOR domain-containing protein [Vulcaniibacterium gelatinicum]
MEPALKQRLVGAAVLVALAVIFLPMLVQGPAPESGVSDVPLEMPAAPEGDYETRDLPLTAPAPAAAEGVIGLDASTPAAAGEAAPAASQPASEPEPAPQPDAAAPAAAQDKLPAPTAGGDYAVNFGSYASVAAADRQVAALRAARMPAWREAVQAEGKTLQRVRIGPFATHAEAEAARLRAQQVRGDVDARVVTLDAAEPAPAPSQPPAPTAAAKPATPPMPAPKPPAASEVGFAVQLGAFSKPAEAVALRDRARAAGFSAFTEQVSTDKGTLTRVRVGPVLARAEAEQLRAQVKARLGIDGLVRPHP